MQAGGKVSATSLRGPPGPRGLLDSVQAGGKISATSLRAALAGEPHYASYYANFLRGKEKSTPLCSHGSPITLTNNVTNGDGVIVVNVLNGDGVNDDGTNVPDDEVTSCHNVADADVVDGGAVNSGGTNVGDVGNVGNGDAGTENGGDGNVVNVVLPNLLDHPRGPPPRRAPPPS